MLSTGGNAIQETNPLLSCREATCGPDTAVHCARKKGCDYSRRTENERASVTCIIMAKSALIYNKSVGGSVIQFES